MVTPQQKAKALHVTPASESQVIVKSFVEEGPERRRGEHGFLQNDSCPTLLKHLKLCSCFWALFAEKDLGDSAPSSQVSSGTFLALGFTTERICWKREQGEGESAHHSHPSLQGTRLLHGSPQL